MFSSGRIGTDPRTELAKGLDYISVPEIYLFLVRQPLSVALSFARVLGWRLYPLPVLSTPLALLHGRFVLGTLVSSVIKSLLTHFAMLPCKRIISTMQTDFVGVVKQVMWH